jgi:hypothetical protein
MIPGDLSPILERLGISGASWVETVRHIGRWFKRALGRGDSLAAAALRSICDDSGTNPGRRSRRRSWTAGFAGHGRQG